MAEGFGSSGPSKATVVINDDEVLGTIKDPEDLLHYI